MAGAVETKPPDGGGKIKGSPPDGGTTDDGVTTVGGVTTAPPGPAKPGMAGP